MCVKWQDSDRTGAGLQHNPGIVTPPPLNARLLQFPPDSDASRSQDVVPRRPGLPQSEQRSLCGKVGTRRPAGRRHDGPLCRVRTAHPGPVPPQRAGPSLARQVRPVLRVQLQPDGEVLLPGGKALLQNGLFQVTESQSSFKLRAESSSRGDLRPNYTVWD